MRIDRVSYEQLRTFGNYENRRISAEARVYTDEDPAHVLTTVQQWVTEQLASSEEKAKLDRMLESLQRQIESKQQALDDLTARWERAQAFLARHGVSVGEDLPF